MKTNEEPSSFREYREEKNMWLYKAYCRIFQAVLKAGNYFMGYRMPDYIEGPGCIKRMPELLKKDNVNNILLVTGPNITKRGLNRGLMEALDEAGISYTVFNNIGANPTSDMVEEGVKLYHEKNCQAIIAFGGGSPMDCAKGIGARIARPNKSIAQLQGLLKVFKKNTCLLRRAYHRRFRLRNHRGGGHNRHRHPPQGGYYGYSPHTPMRSAGSRAYRRSASFHHRLHRYGRPEPRCRSLHQSHLQYKAGKRPRQAGRKANLRQPAQCL